MLPAFSVTPAPLAPPSATPISCEPWEPASNVRPAWPLKLISMVGALPAVVLEATIEVGLVIDGRSLCSVIVPPAIEGSKLMVFGLPGDAALTSVMAARSEPAPLSLRLVTVKLAILTPGREATTSHSPRARYEQSSCFRDRKSTRLNSSHGYISY